jgi:RND family efflux transporter MFP subunit
MKKRTLLMLVALILFSQCGKPAATGSEQHDREDETMIQLTAYSEKFELFAEADPLVKGRECSLLAHFTHLADFKPLLDGKVVLSLAVAGQTVSAEQAHPARPGIYRFTLVPGTAGKGRLTITIAAADVIVIDDLAVHETPEAARQAMPPAVANAQAVTFTKENSWKVEFATARPQLGAFGEVIKSVARIQSAQGDEVIVSAKAAGVVRFSGEHVLEGKGVTAGQGLFAIAGGGLADNNMAVRFAEARNNFQRAKTDHDRIKDLAKDRIVSEKELLKARNEYDNAKAAFDNLDRNFSAGSQVVTAPFAGFIKQVFVQNGQFVNAGQPIVTVAQNRRLVLRADVRQKHAPILAAIVSATIRTLHDNKTYTLEQLNGRILSYGRSVNDDTFLIPISVQVENMGGLLPGGFVEINFKTALRSTALSVPNSAILEDQGNYFVFVQIHPELFEKREVRLGASDGLRTEVTGGIAATKRVVSKGAIWVKLAQGSGELDAHSGHVH